MVCAANLYGKFDTFWTHYFLLQALELTKEDDDLTRDDDAKNMIIQKDDDLMRDDVTKKDVATERQ